MDSDAWRSENDKSKASSLWVNGLWDKTERRQQLRRHCCLECVFQVTVLSGQQKSHNVNGAKADLVVVHEYLSSIFFIINVIPTESLLLTFFEELLGKNPKCALFCSSLGNDPKCRSEETFVSPSSWNFLPDHLCCTGSSP